MLALGLAVSGNKCPYLYSPRLSSVQAVNCRTSRSFAAMQAQIPNISSTSGVPRASKLEEGSFLLALAGIAATSVFCFQCKEKKYDMGMLKKIDRDRLVLAAQQTERNIWLKIIESTYSLEHITSSIASDPDSMYGHYVMAYLKRGKAEDILEREFLISVIRNLLKTTAHPESKKQLFEWLFIAYHRHSENFDILLIDLINENLLDQILAINEIYSPGIPYPVGTIKTTLLKSAEGRAYLESTSLLQ